MDVHYITSATLGRLKLGPPGKQSVDVSQWLRIDLGVWCLQLRLHCYRLAPRRTIRDTLLLNVQHSTCQTQDSLGRGRALDMDQYRSSRHTILLRAGHRVTAS